MQALTWTREEKTVARLAFDRAYTKECEAILNATRERLSSLIDPRDIWQIHDFLSECRKTADGKYDYRYSVLLMVLARLLREGWITEEDIATLSEDKRQRILSMAAI